MGRSRYKVYEPTAPHFLTCTIINWIPVFTRPATVQIILDSFVYLQSMEMLTQKIDYIHFNPVKRGYVDKPEDWRYSSARHYVGREGLIDIYQQWG